MFTQSLIKAQIKENVKAPRHWPLCGDFSGDRWIPRTNGQQRGKCSIWWRHYGKYRSWSTMEIVEYPKLTIACYQIRCEFCPLWKLFWWSTEKRPTVYPKKYAHGFVVLCFVVVTQSFIMNSHEVFIHIHQGCFAGTGAIVRLPQCQWSKPDGYGKISQCITTTQHSKA